MRPSRGLSTQLRTLPDTSLLTVFQAYAVGFENTFLGLSFTDLSGSVLPFDEVFYRCGSSLERYAREESRLFLYIPNSIDPCTFSGP